MPVYTEYINPNKSNLGFTLSNWTFDTSDRFEMTYKMNSAPNTQGNWPKLLATAASMSAKLLVQFNLWGGRNCMNFAYNGSWSGDATVSYNSPYDYTNYYKVSLAGGTFTIKKGSSLDAINDTAGSHSFSSAAGTTGELIKLFCNVSTDGKLDMNFYGLKVWNHSGTLIHDYVPIVDGLYDNVDGTSYMATTTGHINGPVLLPAYTVHFSANGGTGTMADQRIEVGASVALEDNVFTKSGYLFKGWDTSSAGTTVVYTDGQTVTDLAQAGATVTLYAVWELAWAYLLKGSDNKIYTMDASQNLTEVAGVSTLTKAVFLAYGFQTTPTTATLESLGNPTIYKWDALSPPTLQAKVSAVPYPQPIKTVVDLSGVQITGIQALEATYSGNVNACYSYDDASYTSPTTLAAFLAADKDALYAGLGASKMLYIKFILTDENATLTSFKLTYKRRPFTP